MQKKFICAIIFLSIISAHSNARAEAQSIHEYSHQENVPVRNLTADEMGRLRSCKRLLGGVDTKSFEQSLFDLKHSSFPHENLQILEAMTKTYTEIVQEQNVVGQKKKEWLYSMVALNMAYLQLAGINATQSQDSPLDKLIRWKLKEHLPEGLKENKKIFHPLKGNKS